MKSLVAVLLLGAVAVASASQCLHTCSRRERYNTRCGLFGWGRCVRYRTVTYNCYQYCENGGWSEYRVKSEGQCSLPCGGGKKTVTYQRTCTNPAPSKGGSDCSGEAQKEEEQACNTQECPIDGGWSNFTVDTVGDCSKTCGTGSQQLTFRRTCTDPIPQYGGRNCTGDDTMTQLQSCNPNPCPKNGGWSEYTVKSEGQCSLPCGGGKKMVTYQRTCTNPAPYKGGSNCSGEAQKEEEQACNTQECPIDGGWSNFTVDTVGDCSKTCGTGSQQLTFRRTCTDPKPQYGGRNCTGDDTMTQLQSCNPNPCPIDGGWSDFTAWEDYECSALCGKGSKDQWRSRTCDNPVPAFGGKLCQGPDKENQTVDCNAEPCGDKCPADKDTYISNQNNSSRYYHCDNGVARLQQCQPNTRWDQDTLACVHAEDQEAVALKQGDECDPDILYNFHPDCAKYVMCFNGRAFVMSCPAGTRFSYAISACDHEENVPCLTS